MRLTTLLASGLVVAATVSATGQEHRASATPPTWKFGAAPAEPSGASAHADTRTQAPHPRPAKPTGHTPHAAKPTGRTPHAATAAAHRVLLRWPAESETPGWVVLRWPATAPAVVTLEWPVVTTEKR